jgi:hypothetical protein
MPGKNYRDLIAWQRAMDFTVAVYEASKAFPREELYGLTSQLRRSSVSVPSNIAEGQGRRAEGYFKNSLLIAHGSLRPKLRSSASGSGFSAPKLPTNSSSRRGRSAGSSQACQLP